MAYTKKENIAHEMYRILNAPKVEESLKKELNDDNVIFKYYDRNKAMRVRSASAEGQSVGTCVQESINNFGVYFMNDYKPKMMRGMFKTKFKGDGLLFHAWLEIYVDGKWYVDSKANGLHKRVPKDYYYKINKGILVELEQQVINVKMEKLDGSRAVLVTDPTQIVIKKKCP